MTLIEVSLFGPPQIRRDDRLVSVASSKATALLAYLAVTRRAHAREEVAALFWPESDHKRARGALRYTLSLLKNALGTGHLRADRQAIRLKQDAQLSVDIGRFRQCLVQVDQLRAEGVEGDAFLTALETAVDLYQDDLLSGFGLRDAPAFDEWVYFEAEQLRRELARAVQLAIEWHTSCGQAELALEYARRWMKLDPYHEPAQRQLIYLYGSADQWTAARDQYESCRRLLSDDLGLNPAPETEALQQSVLAREFGEVDVPYPLMAPSPVPKPIDNLPRPASHIFGREEMMAGLANQLVTKKARLLTLKGPGGIGKTRLALALARRLLSEPETAIRSVQPAEPEDRLYRDGVCFVALASIQTHEYLVSAVADALEVTFYEGRPPREQLLDYLRPRHLLLILDNLEHLLIDDASAVTSLIKDILAAAPDVTVLVTSRIALDMRAEHVCPVPGLSLKHGRGTGEHSAAAQLFKAHAFRVKPDFAGDHEVIDEICALMDGLPLAIEMAAALVGGLPLNGIAEQLRRDLDVLSVRWPDGEQRHRSIRAVFNSSWATLTHVEQQALARLTLFQGGFAPEAALQVAETGTKILTQLVRKSLLVLDRHGRYHLHPLLRRYATEQRSDSMSWTRTLRRRHADYFTNRLQEGVGAWKTTYGAQYLAAIMAEVDDIRSAWRWILNQGDATEVDPFLRCLCRYFKARGQFGEAVSLLNEALGHGLADRRPPPCPMQADWERLLGDAYFGLGQAAESGEHFRQAVAFVDRPIPSGHGQQLLAILKESGRQLWHRVRMPAPVEDCPTLATAARAYDGLTQLGYLHNELLLPAYTAVRGLNIAETGAPEATTAVAYANMSLLSSLAPRRAGSDRYARLAQQAATRSREIRILAEVGLRDGVHRSAQGQWSMARARIETALVRFRQIGDRRRTGDCLSILGACSLLQGRFDESRRLGDELATLVAESGNQEHGAWSIFGRALTAHYQGDDDQALELLAAGKPLLANLAPGPVAETNYYGLTALCQLIRADDEAATAQAFQTVEMAAHYLASWGIGVFFVMAFGYCSLAEVYLRMWRRALTTPHFAVAHEAMLRKRSEQALRALRRYERLHPIGRPYYSLYRGYYEWLDGRPERARRIWQQGLLQAQRLGMRHVEVQIRRAPESWAVIDIDNNIGSHEQQTKGVHFSLEKCTRNLQRR